MDKIDLGKLTFKDFFSLLDRTTIVPRHLVVTLNDKDSDGTDKVETMSVTLDDFGNYKLIPIDKDSQEKETTSVDLGVVNSLSIVKFCQTVIRLDEKSLEEVTFNLLNSFIYNLIKNDKSNESMLNDILLKAKIGLIDQLIKFKGYTFGNFNEFDKLTGLYIGFFKLTIDILNYSFELLNKISLVKFNDDKSQDDKGRKYKFVFISRPDVRTTKSVDEKTVNDINKC